MTIADVMDKIYENLGKKYPVVAVLPTGEKINVSKQYSVEDETCYMFKSKDSSDIQTLAYMHCDIEKEGEEECWQPSSINDRNKFLDCFIAFVDTYSDEEKDNYNGLVFNVESIEVKNHKFYFYCF